MSTPPLLLANPTARLRGVGAARARAREAFRRAVEIGLTSEPKRLAHASLYEGEHSQHQQRLCERPEYYLARAEREILAAHALEIVTCLPLGGELVELGSADTQRTAILIRAALLRSSGVRHVTIDPSPRALEANTRRLLAAQPRLEVLGICAGYGAGLLRLSRSSNRGKLILWLGSNAGSIERGQAAEELACIRAWMSPSDRLLIGLDLRKDADVLERAHDDGAGISARSAFELLEQANRELGADFEASNFRYRARYSVGEGRVKMGLVSRIDHLVSIDALHLRVRFAADEFVHTSDSYKYSPSEIRGLAQSAGFEISQRWLDRRRQYALTLLAPG